MAYKVVEHEEKSFHKWTQVGQLVEGYYLSDEPGNFNKQDYSFKKSDGSIVVVSAGGSLKAQLEKAALEPGYKVAVKLIRQEPTEHANPKNVFKVLVDDSPGPMPKTAPVKKAAPVPETEEDPFA